VLEPFCLVRPAEGAGRRFVTVTSVPWAGPGRMSGLGRVSFAGAILYPENKHSRI